MPASKGTQPPGGSRKGIPNKLTSDVRDMIRTALERAGGADYLLAQSEANPKAFLSLVGRLVPQQVTGKDDAPLIPERASDPERVAHALLLLLQASQTRGGESTAAVAPPFMAIDRRRNNGFRL